MDTTMDATMMEAAMNQVGYDVPSADVDNWGPVVWHEMHAYALSPPPLHRDIVTFYTVTVRKKIRCVSCLEKYIRLIRVHPIPSNPDHLFGWTVTIHNIVNLMLRKPVMEIDEARRLTLQRINQPS